jgi:hypothetical protein
VSDESGSQEIYVRSSSENTSRPGGKWQVSSGNAENQPVWSRTRRELFFVAGGRMMLTEYQSDDGTFVSSKPRVWSTMPPLGDTGFSKYDLTPDGKRIATLTRPQPDADSRPPRMNLLLNFFDEIRRLAPTE